MNTPPRQHSPLDTAILKLDRLLKSAVGPHVAGRPYPAAAQPETITEAAAKRQIAGLMRVNHAGEICAQALYHGQAATARTPEVRDAMLHAAQEEADHLAWCAQRLAELGDRPSLLDPLWYLGSFAIGALAGISGDRRSLGFVAETERQVTAHLQAHVERLPQDDARTRAILKQMISDEMRHGGEALNQGGELPPAPIQQVMKLTAKVMTATAQYI
ncbi:MAG: 2-polyprenyl-3-methyl-6-methoxy-1,4-benzoquinone monooxygenase [Steroidobacteraceae bacterium]